jgi:MoxR-like ATPase
MPNLPLPPRRLGAPVPEETPQVNTPNIGAPIDNSESSISRDEASRAESIIGRISTSYSRRVVGQHELQRNLLVALLSGGHILLESVPGLAKTTAAQTLASTVRADFKRIQCTPDLLPSDIVGTQIYEQRTGTFKTQLGPVHANFVLLDEINRSSSKTQSAMLEAMQERQTSIGGEVYKLPHPFLVVATQNPIEQEGTYHLPEAQLDRFLIKDILRYPTPNEELEILSRIDSGVLDLSNHDGEESVPLEDVLFLQELSSKVYVDSVIRQYIINLVSSTRNLTTFLPHETASLVEYGASPRASIAFLQASRALALIKGRTSVIPEDVKDLRHGILRHRLILNYEADIAGVTVENIIDQLFDVIPAP